MDASVVTALASQLGAEDTHALTETLRALTHGVRAAVGDQLVGVYLTGSFALGCGDEHSDVDFLVVHEGVLGPREALVGGLHARLPGLHGPWSLVLEGSYAPTSGLRERASGTEWLYVDNGQRTVESSTHDNTEVLRWTLRNHALRLHGPVPTTLLPPVPPEALRAEAAEIAARRAADALSDLDYLANGWGQPHEVLTQCRMLFTAHTGAVTGKVAAGRWARERLPERWHTLVDAAISSRPNPWVRVHGTADPAMVALMPAFIAYISASTQEAATRQTN